MKSNLKKAKLSLNKESIEDLSIQRSYKIRAGKGTPGTVFIPCRNAISVDPNLCYTDKYQPWEVDTYLD